MCQAITLEHMTKRNTCIQVQLCNKWSWENCDDLQCFLSLNNLAVKFNTPWLLHDYSVALHWFCLPERLWRVITTLTFTRYFMKANSYISNLCIRLCVFIGNLLKLFPSFKSDDPALVGLALDDFFFILPERFKLLVKHSIISNNNLSVNDFGVPQGSIFGPLLLLWTAYSTTAEVQFFMLHNSPADRWRY